MFDQVNQAIDEYWGKWEALVGARKNKEFFDRLRPTSIGWKTVDQAEFDQLFVEWRSACDQIHLAWLNDRWLATMHLKDAKLSHDIEVIKLMGRRPNSTDAVGLDHLDFLDMEETNTIAVLDEEGLKWTDEKNNLCVWKSIWFDNTEAKLRNETVIDVGIAELNAVNNKIRGDRFKNMGRESSVVITDVE